MHLKGATRFGGLVTLVGVAAIVAAGCGISSGDVGSASVTSVTGVVTTTTTQPPTTVPAKTASPTTVPPTTVPPTTAPPTTAPPTTAPPTTAPPTTTPPTTTPPTTFPATPTSVVTLTNPDDLSVALEQAAQQLMGMNDPSATDVQAFINWYHAQEVAFETGQSNVEPPTPADGADYWIRQQYPEQVAANNYLGAYNVIQCMIASGGIAGCAATTTTNWLLGPG